jgi:hypothetical protein
MAITKRSFANNKGPPKADNPFKPNFDRLVEHYVRKYNKL